MSTRVLVAELLTAEGFAPFGEVVQAEGARHYPINAGTIERFHDLARVEHEPGGRVLISLARANRVATLPHRVTVVERHPLGSQAFIPLSPVPMVVVVAPAGDRPNPDALRAFVTNGRQGVNYRRGTWHMPLIALDPAQEFLIVDRGGPGANCEEVVLDREVTVSA